MLRPHRALKRAVEVRAENATRTAHPESGTVSTEKPGDRQQESCVEGGELSDNG